MNGKYFSFLFGGADDDSGMAETESFSIKYNGEALADHSIDVNDLAPSLMALGDLFQEANRVANGDASKVSIKVKATGGGSFQVLIAAIQNIDPDVVKILAGDKVTAISNLTSLLWWGVATASATVGGVCYLIKRFGKNPPKKATQKGDNQIEIETDGGNITITKLEWELYQNPTIRKAFHEMIKPLEKPGVEEVEFIGSETKRATVKKEEVSLFIPPGQPQQHLLDLPIRDTFVNVVHMWFKGDNKWKFNEGGSEWTATVKDDRFNKDVASGKVAIRASDLLKVRVKQTQRRVGSTVYSDFEVLEVLEHHKSYEQMPLQPDLTSKK